MSTETWEEIREWEADEDFDVIERITVCTIPNPSDDEGGDNYQLVQTFKGPTYAAAAKLGLKKGIGGGSPKVDENAAPVVSTATATSPTTTSNSGKAAARREVDEAEKLADVAANTPSKPIVVQDDFDASAVLGTQGETRSATRRVNTKLHKLQTRRLNAQLVGQPELSSSRGDTNRNPEFVKAKICKKALKHNKSGKKERKGFQKMREVL